MQPNFLFTVQQKNEKLRLIPDQTATQQPSAGEEPIVCVMLPPELMRQTCILSAVQPLGGKVSHASVQQGDRVTLRLPPSITAGKPVFLTLRVTDLFSAQQSETYKLSLS